MIPDPIYSNVGRRLAGENIYHEHNILVAIAGGLPATLPFEDEFFNEKTAPFLKKYWHEKRESLRKTSTGASVASVTSHAPVSAAFGRSPESTAAARPSWRPSQYWPTTI